MRKAIEKDFRGATPRAVVLDDNANARKTLSRRLKKHGFDVQNFSTAEEFEGQWQPGTVDVIVADWHLDSDPHKQGDSVLMRVRAKDWNVPFVLISGQLGDSSERAEVLEKLLHEGNAAFVQRGHDGIAEAVKCAEDLVEKRDLSLLKVILSIRPAALQGLRIMTSSGELSAAEFLASLVSKPNVSKDASRPLANASAKRVVP
jgi:CheY-like chemotaxis protein